MKSTILRFWWILLCACIALWGASAVLAGHKHASRRFDDLTLNIVTSPIQGAQASVIGVNATVTNNSDHVIYLNQVAITIWDTDLIAGDGLPFFVNFTGPLAPGQSITNKRLFELDIDVDAPVGTHYGTAAILGGADADGEDNQAQQDFTVDVVAKDTAPPDTTITGGPDDGGNVCVNTATFTFTGTDNVTPTDQLTYQYRIDSGDWQTTFDTQATVSNLTEGIHSFDVEAIDASGNIDPTPARRTFAVLLTPPTISGVSATPRDVKATVSWTTNRPATSEVEYGTTTAYGQTSGLNANKDGLHSVVLTGLTPKTTYHYRIKSSDGCHDAASDDQMFTTLDVLFPNLSITSLKFTTPVRALDAITISWQVLNSGQGDALGTWVDSVYLSDTPTLDANAQLLGKFDRASELESFNSYDQSRQIQMPLKPAGNYYIIVKADGDNKLTESSEDDNTLAMPIEFLKVSNLVATPDQITLSLNPTIAVQGEVQLGNLSGGPLTGITATIENPQANLNIQVSPPSTVNSLAIQTATYTVTASDESILTSAPVIHFTTKEGEDARVTLNVTVIPRRPQLMATPGSFMGGMTRGKQNTLEVQITNTGSVYATGLKVNIPQISWLSLASPDTIGSLAPGATTTISLLLSPTQATGLGSYTGNIALNGTNTSLLLPFDIACTSDAKGDLKVIAEDEYTYFADTKPPVAGAAIVIKNPQTDAIVAQGTTDDNGTLELLKLPEGSYNLEATAATHGTAKLSLTILPGQEITVKPFLPRQLVTYTWNVVPVDTPDMYTIDLNATFETHVPAPVVTMSPLTLDVTKLQFDASGKTVVNYVLTNHGLIASNSVSLTFGTSQKYTFKPFKEQLGQLPALSTIIVPVTITKLQIGLLDRHSRYARLASCYFDTECNTPCKCEWHYQCGGDKSDSCTGVCRTNDQCPLSYWLTFWGGPGYEWAGGSLNGPAGIAQSQQCSCKLAIWRSVDGGPYAPITGDKNVMVGRRMQFQAVAVNDMGTQEGCPQPTNVQWTINGPIFKDYQVGDTSASIVPLLDISTNPITFTWYNKGTFTVRCEGAINGESSSASITYNVFRPHSGDTATTPGAIVAFNGTDLPRETRIGVYTAPFTNPDDYVNKYEGLIANATVTTASEVTETAGRGQAWFIQIIASSTSTYTKEDGSEEFVSINGSLDGNFPYCFQMFKPAGETTQNQITDTPGFHLANLLRGERTDSFDTYILFRPTENDIWVAYAKYHWSWAVDAKKLDAQNNLSKTGKWTIVSHSDPDINAFWNNEYLPPEWKHVNPFSCSQK